MTYDGNISKLWLLAANTANMASHYNHPLGPRGWHRGGTFSYNIKPVEAIVSSERWSQGICNPILFFRQMKWRHGSILCHGEHEGDFKQNQILQNLKMVWLWKWLENWEVSLLMWLPNLVLNYTSQLVICVFRAYPWAVSYQKFGFN